MQLVSECRLNELAAMAVLAVCSASDFTAMQPDDRQSVFSGILGQRCVVRSTFRCASCRRRRRPAEHRTNRSGSIRSSNTSFRPTLRRQRRRYRLKFIKSSRLSSSRPSEATMRDRAATASIGPSSSKVFPSSFTAAPDRARAPFLLCEEMCLPRALVVADALDIEVVDDAADLLELIVGETDLARLDALLDPVRVGLRAALHQLWIHDGPAKERRTEPGRGRIPSHC